MGKWDALVLVVWLAAAAAIAVMYPRLPAVVPSHWDAYGRVDGYMSRGLMVLMGLGLPVAIYALMTVLPRIDPRRENYARFAGAYGLIRAAVAILITGIFAVALATGAGHPLPVERIAPVAVGLLFVLIGNVMGQVRHNYFVGIRTPWTLADEEVWRRTHRFGSLVFVVAGLAMTLVGVVGPGGAWVLSIMLPCILAVTLLPVVYSYMAWRRLGGMRP